MVMSSASRAAHLTPMTSCVIVLAAAALLTDVVELVKAQVVVIFFQGKDEVLHEVVHAPMPS